MQCRVCGHAAGKRFLSLPGMPVEVASLWHCPGAAAGVPRADIVLSVCPRCGAVSNQGGTAGDVGTPDRPYESAHHHWDRFRRFRDRLVADLVATALGDGGVVVEIGCGSGHFLGALCRASGARGIGFDPAHDPRHRDHGADHHVDISPRRLHPGALVGVADLVVARHVLDHVADPAALLRVAATALRPGGWLYVEVPDAEVLLHDGALWDVVHERRTHFTADSLRWLATTTGASVAEVTGEHDGQYLGLRARFGSGPALPVSTVDATATVLAARRFGRDYEQLRREWHGRVWRHVHAGRRLAIWGAGPRAVTFANLLGLTGSLTCAVDPNPRRQGSYLAGTGTPILAPRMLQQIRPDIVIVLTPGDEGAVRAGLAELEVPATVLGAGRVRRAPQPTPGLRPPARPSIGHRATELRRPRPAV